MLAARVLLLQWPRLHDSFCARAFPSVVFPMAQPDRNSQKGQQAKRNDPNFNWRGVILFAIAFALIGLAVLFRGGTGYGNVEDVPYNRFLDLLENKQIVNDTKFPLRSGRRGRPANPEHPRCLLSSPGSGNAPAQQVPFRTTIYLNFTTDLQEKLAAAKVPIAIQAPSRTSSPRRSSASSRSRSSCSFSISFSASRSAWPAKAR